MQRRFSKEPTEQIEAKAVSNLLQIALKQHEDSNNWEQRKASGQLQNKNRTHSHFRLKEVPEQHRIAKNYLKNRNFILSHEKPSPNELANSLKEPSSGRSDAGLPNEEPSQQIQGDFWLSKVNWMVDSSNKDHPSQLRLHRKRSTGFQNHGKAARQRGGRYQNPEKVLSRELKQNLALNLSKERMRSKQEANISKTNNHPSIQEYVRETFDKLYERHHEENAYSPYKQSEQQKSTIVRKLLNNLLSIKDVPQRRNYRQRIDPSFLSKQMNEVISAPPIPRRTYHKKDQRSILNLNEEAEKVYQSRSINQFARKDAVIHPQ